MNAEKRQAIRAAAAATIEAAVCGPWTVSALETTLELLDELERVEKQVETLKSQPEQLTALAEIRAIIDPDKPERMMQDELVEAVKKLKRDRDRYLRQNHVLAKDAIDRLWTEAVEKLKREHDELRAQIDGAVTVEIKDNGVINLSHYPDGETRTFKLLPVPVNGPETAQTDQGDSDA